MKYLLRFRYTPRAASRVLVGLWLLSALSLRAHVALAWNKTLEAAFAESRSPAPLPIEARIYAMTHLAIEEAIVSVAQARSSFPHALPAADVAGSAAAYQVLLDLWPEAQARFAALHERERDALPEGEERTRAERIGRDAAALVLQKRAEDHWVMVAANDSPSAALADLSPLAANCTATGAALRSTQSPWLAARPFMLKNARQFETPEPNRLVVDGTTRTNYELQDMRFFRGVDRSGPADALPRAWAGDAIVTWNRVARAVLATLPPDDRWQEVRTLAVLNLAMADATIAAEDARRYLGSWRSTLVDVWEPTTDMDAQSGDIVATVDGDRTAVARLRDQPALIPPLRNFPSVAATVAGAAEATLSACCHGDRITFTVPDSAGGAGRSFTRISQAARESVFVAMIDGRHTLAACIAGHQLGLSVGNYVGKRAAQTK